LEHPDLEKLIQEDPKYADESALLKTALQNRADFKASQELADSFSWKVKAASADYYPKLNLNANILSTARFLNNQIVNGTDQVPSFQEFLSVQLGDHISYNIGITLTWNLFDHWQRKPRWQERGPMQTMPKLTL
jgi:outer membrane protein TolC